MQSWLSSLKNQISNSSSMNPSHHSLADLVFPRSSLKNASDQDGVSNLSFTTKSPTEVGDDYYYGFPIVACFSVAIVIFMLLAIVGNTMVILTVARHSGMRTRTNMFIVNLAVADILTALIDMPVSLTTVIHGGWIFGTSFCLFNGFTLPLFLISSIHTLMYISIHKYVSITRPFSKSMTPTRILIMIAAAWSWAFFCATAPLAGWNKIVYKKGASQCGPSVPDDWLELSHSIMITTSNYVVPLSVMIFCYCHIFREIEEHMVRMRETSSVDLKNTLDQQKRISFTLFLVLACFMVCWTPFVAYSSALAFLKDKSKMPPIANPVAYWCGYLNSACNPIIYALRSPSFRQGYKEIMFGKRHQYTFSCRNQSLSGRSSQATSGTFPIARGFRKKLLGELNWNSLPILPFCAKRAAPSNLHLSNSLPGAKSNRTLALQTAEHDPAVASQSGFHPRALLYLRNAQSLPVTPRHESYGTMPSSNLRDPSVLANLHDFSTYGATGEKEALGTLDSSATELIPQKSSIDDVAAPVQQEVTVKDELVDEGVTPERTGSEGDMDRERKAKGIPGTRRPSSWIINFLPSLCFRRSTSTSSLAVPTPANLVRSMSVEVLHCSARRTHDFRSPHSVLQRKYQSFPPTHFSTKWLLNLNRRRHKHKAAEPNPGRVGTQEESEL